MATKLAQTIGLPESNCSALDHPIFVHGTDISDSVFWKGGIEWPAADCIDAKLSPGCFVDPCSDEERPNTVIVPCTSPCDLEVSAPFTVYAAVNNCDIQSFSQLEDMARSAVNKDFGRRVARALMTGFNGLASVATPITGASGSAKPLAIGIGLLAQNRCGVTWYSIPETILPVLVSQGLIQYVNGLPTLLGQPVIPVPTNTPPDGETAGDGFWIYGHGPVEYAIDAAARTRNNGATGARGNDRCGIAERDAMVRVDPCRVFAVKVTVPEC